MAESDSSSTTENSLLGNQQINYNTIDTSLSDDDYQGQQSITYHTSEASTTTLQNTPFKEEEEEEENKLGDLSLTLLTIW